MLDSMTATCPGPVAVKQAQINIQILNVFHLLIIFLCVEWSSNNPSQIDGQQQVLL